MGKSSGGSGGGTTKTVAEPWKASQPFLQQLLGDTSAQYGGGGLDIMPWPGIRVAPQSGMTTNALQQFSDIATAGNPVTGPAQQGFTDFMSADPYRDLDLLKENALGDIMPAAMSRFSGAGMLDSTLAADAAGRAATQAIAPFEYGAWNNQQGRKLGALGMAPQMAGLSFLDPQMLMQAGGQQDAFSQNVLNSAIGAYGEQAGRPYDELQRAASLALGFGGLGGTGKETKRSGGGGGGTMETVGGIMQVVGPLIMMAAMSDRRLKRDIVRVGETDNGLPLYMFRYKSDEANAQMRLGLMADDVEAVCPEAIIARPDGYLMVDYAMALRERAA